MKKREFLAMSGAVPLMLAGCGGDGAGNAPVRLVNASVGYPLLGFMDETTQAATGVAYGSASAFESVQAGSVTLSLTVDTSNSTGTSSSTATLAPTTRTLSKSSTYDLVAYGFQDELRTVLLTESTVAPDTGKANINVLNTSVDIGAVDVYISPGTDLSVATLIASSVGSSTSIGQSPFSGVLAGSYFITVVGANTLQQGIKDIRFQSPSAVAFVDQQIVTIILTPGTSGTLANAIILTQGTTVTSGNAAQSFTNATARVRAVSGLPAGTSVVVTNVLATGETGTVQTLLSTKQPNFGDYVSISARDSLSVSINGATQTITGITSGGDFTLLVYTDPGTSAPKVQLVTDDNTAPILPTGVKFRVINLAYSAANGADQVDLSLYVNSVLAANNVPYGTASVYKELPVSQTVQSVVELRTGTTVLHSLPPQVLTAGRVFTELVLGLDTSTTPATVNDAFFASVDN